MRMLERGRLREHMGDRKSCINDTTSRKQTARATANQGDVKADILVSVGRSRRRANDAQRTSDQNTPSPVIALFNIGRRR